MPNPRALSPVSEMPCGCLLLYIYVQLPSGGWRLMDTFKIILLHPLDSPQAVTRAIVGVK